MRLHSRRGRKRPRTVGHGRQVLRKRRQRRAQLGQRTLVIVPHKTRRHGDGRVVVQNARIPGGQRRPPLTLRQQAGERLVQFGVKSPRAGDEGPLQFLVRAQKQRAHDDARHRRRTGLGIGDGQQRAPRAADDKPPPDSQFLPYHLQVGDQVLRGVLFKAAFRRAFPGAALVRRDDAKPARRKQTAQCGAAAAARAAVQKQRRAALFGAVFLHRQVVDGAGAETPAAGLLRLRAGNIVPGVRPGRLRGGAGRAHCQARA